MRNILNRIFNRRKVKPLSMRRPEGLLIILRVQCLQPMSKEIAMATGSSWTEVATLLESKVRAVRPGYFALDFISALSSLAGQIDHECVGVQSKYGQFQITRSNL